MNLLSIFIVSFTIALSGALAPGPLLAAVIYESTRKGFLTGPLMMLGHAVLEVIMIAFIILGFARFIDDPAVLKTISVLGALILCYFGIKMLLSLPSLSLEIETGYRGSSNLPLMGFTMSLANPYWTIWWLTIGLGLVLGARGAGITGIAVFFAGHILADIGWYSVVSFVFSKGKKFISLAVYRLIICACAVLLLGFGLWFGTNALRTN